MQFQVSDELSVICFRRNLKNGPFFSIREFDTKIIRSPSKHKKGRGPSEQAIRASIRQAVLNMSLKSERASKAEIRLLKSQAILGKRAPSCSLLCAEDMIKLLESFSKTRCARDLRESVRIWRKENPVGTPGLEDNLPDDDSSDHDDDDYAPSSSSSSSSSSSAPSLSSGLGSGGSSPTTGKRSRSIRSPREPRQSARQKEVAAKKQRVGSASRSPSPRALFPNGGGLEALLSALVAHGGPLSPSSSPSPSSPISPSSVASNASNAFSLSSTLPLSLPSISTPISSSSSPSSLAAQAQANARTFALWHASITGSAASGASATSASSSSLPSFPFPFSLSATSPVSSPMNALAGLNASSGLTSSSSLLSTLPSPSATSITSPSAVPMPPVTIPALPMESKSTTSGISAPMSPSPSGGSLPSISSPLATFQPAGSPVAAMVNLTPQQQHELQQQNLMLQAKLLHLQQQQQLYQHNGQPVPNMATAAMPAVSVASLPSVLSVPPAQSAPALSTIPSPSAASDAAPVLSPMVSVASL